MDFLILIASAFFSALLVGAWTFMILVWFFKADIRSWLIATFPQKWRGDTTRREAFNATATLTTYWIAASPMPVGLAHLLLCRYCMSAHIAGFGALIVALAGGFNWLLPLVWAGGAGIGLLTYGKAFTESNGHQNLPPDQRDPNSPQPDAGRTA